VAISKWLGSCLTATVLVTPVAASAQPTSEPPLEVVLELNGQLTEATAEQPFKVKLAGGEVPARISIRPTRLLKTAELSFRYPRAHGFQVETEGDGTTWTLDGSDNTVILTRFAGRTDPAAFMQTTVDTIVGGLGKSITRNAAAQATFAGRTHKGRALTFSLAGQTLAQEIFAFAAGPATYSLIVQDMPTEGRTSAETEQVMNLLRDTLSLGK
jgi:hypothetical protein